MKVLNLIHFKGWYTEDCSKPCVNGYVNAENSFCHCDDCYTGAGCELECSGNGLCVNGTCDCFTVEPGMVFNTNLLSQIGHKNENLVKEQL